MNETPITDETQRELFACAAELLGGQRATARALDVTDRTVRALLAGERPLHAGFLRDVAAALIAHADACRKLERRLSPAFLDNLTAAQRDENPRDGRRYDRREPNVGNMADG
jgi:hypothetical protein